MNKLTRYSIKQKMLDHFKMIGLFIVFITFFGQINAQQLKSTETVNTELLKPTVKYDKLDANKTQVAYSFENKRELNPYAVSYDYFITTDATGTFIETKSFLDDLDLRLEDKVELNYDGVEVFYPSELKVTTDLDDVEGKFTITIPNANLKLFYDIKISDRKVIEIKEVNINGQTHVAYLIKSNFQNIKYADTEMISQSNEELLDLYIPSLGNVKRERTGNLSARNGEIKISKTSSNIILQ